MSQLLRTITFPEMPKFNDVADVQRYLESLQGHMSTLLTDLLEEFNGRIEEANLKSSFITDLATKDTPDVTNDYVMLYDASSNVHKKAAVGSLGNHLVAKSLFDANTILAANVNDTPTAVTVAEQQVLGRLTSGNIKGLSIAEMQTLLGAGNSHVVLFPLLYSSVVQGTWVWVSNVNSSYGGYWQNSTSDNGDGLQWNRFMSAGTYTLTLLYLKTAAGGIADIYIDTTEVGSVDMYASVSAHNQLYTVTNIVVPTTGLKTLKIVIDGKHASSSGYRCYFMNLCFDRTA